MNITATSIRKPVFAWMIMASLMLFGGIAYTRMGVNLMPAVEFPTISVNVQWEGAAPTAIETDVIDELEDSLAGIAGIQNVNSSARTGSGNINLEFGLDKDIDIAMQEVQNAVFRAQRRLPIDVEPPTISKQNPDDQPIIWAAVASETVPRLELMEYVRDHVKNQFSVIDGVSEVFLGGYVDPAVRIWVSQKKLEGLELTVDDVIATVRNESNESPAGRLETKAKELSVRTAGEVNSVEELAKLPILRRGGAPLFTSLKLGDVVDIEMGSLDVRRLTRSDGTAAIGLGVRKQSGANAVAVAERVKQRIEEIRPMLPPGVTIGVRSDSTRFISEAVEELVFTLLLAAILTAVICWLFLGSFRATINVVLAIPTSIFGTFIVCHALGFTLNTFTLLGLSLAIGIVVDDAIMVLENIYRHRAMNKTSPQAAYDGTKEVAFAAMAATAAIAAIFLPIAYMEGIIGRFLFEFGITIAVAVGFSLLEALTLTPMRCALIKDHTEHVGFIERSGNAFFEFLARIYKAILGPVLHFRWLVLLASVAMFAGTVYLFPLLKKELVPAQDQDMLMLRLQAPTGSTLQYTDEKSREIEAILAARPEVKQTFVSIGGFGGGEVDTGMIFITLHPKAQRPVGPEGKKLSQSELASTLRDVFKEVKGIRANVIDPSVSGGIGGGGGRSRSVPISVAIVGDNWDKLIDATNKIKEEMESSGTFVDIDSNFRPGLPEIVVEPDRAAAARRGVSIADIDRTVSVLVGGSTIGQLTRDGRRFDIRLRLQENERQSIEVFRKIFVRNNRGENVRLADVATIKEQQSLQSIFRKNRERSISLYSNLARGVAQTDGMAQLDAIAAKHLPQGYRVIREGTSQSLDESMTALQFALIMGILVAYMILASQFNSFIDPITILAALPFSLTGALAALWFTGHTINIFSVIGIVLLMGIVKKNSILLVDFANQVRDQGKDVRDALLVACPLRLRPILMTSIATICGILPAALAIGPGSESRAPMAIAVLGGVTVSTILTLIVVPALYYVVSGRKRRILKFVESHA